MKFLKGLFSALGGFIKGGGAERAFGKVAEIVPRALPIVDAIAALTPTRADDEILAAFQHFGVPLLLRVEETPAEKRGLLLFDLATGVLGKRYPGTATNLIQSAVQIAVTAHKAR
jgi:hypothetical protein